MATGLKTVLKRELNRITSESIYLWMLLILPMFTFLLFPTMFSAGKAEGFSVAIVDHDNSPLSRKLISWIEATPEVHFSHKINSLQEGKRLIEKGDVYAVLKIPKDLEKGVYSGLPNKLVLFYSNTNLSAGSGVSTSIIKTVKTMSAGINMQKRMSKNKEMYTQALHNVQPIRIDAHTLYNPYINYSYYLVIGLLPVMLLMFIISTTIYAIGSELKNGTALEWYELSSKSITVALAGKLLPYTVIFIIEAYFMNFILLGLIGVPKEGNLLVLFIATTMFVIAYQAAAIFLITIFPNMRMALSLGAMYASLAFSFAGLTFPEIGMNGFMQGFAQLFPFTHYLKIYINVEMKGLDLYYTISPFIYLGIFIITPIVLGPRIRAIMIKEKYWGHS